MADTTDIADPQRETSRYASRKFLITVGLLVANVALLYVGLIDKTLYVDSAKWITALYFGANVATWAAELLKGKSSA